MNEKLRHKTNNTTDVEKTKFEKIDINVEYSNKQETKHLYTEQNRHKLTFNVQPTLQRYTEHRYQIPAEETHNELAWQDSKSLESLVEIDVCEVPGRTFRHSNFLVVEYHPLITTKNVTDVMATLCRRTHVTDKGHKPILLTNNI